MTTPLLWEIVYISTLKIGDQFFLKPKGAVYTFQKRYQTNTYQFNLGWDLYYLTGAWDRKVYRLLKTYSHDEKNKKVLYAHLS